MYATCFLFVLSSNCIIEVSSYVTWQEVSDLFSLLQFSNVHIPRSAAPVRSLNCKKGGWLAGRPADRPGAPGPGCLGRLEQESGRSAAVTNSRIDYFYGHCYCKIDGCPGARKLPATTRYVK